MIPAPGAPTGANGPAGIAITPSGRTVYVSDQADGTVIPIDVATRTAGTPIPVASGPHGIAVTPDSATAYVISASPIDSVARQLTPIDTATNTAEAPIALGNVAATQFAITPDGRTAYVWTWSRQLVPVDLADGTVGAALTPLGASDAVVGSTGQVVISPDGGLASAMGDTCETGCTGLGFEFDLGTGSETPGFTDTDPSRSYWFDPWTPIAAAFVPGPAAAFSSTRALAGQSSSFDATGSVDPGGSVIDYHWAFGDGSQATSSSPTITHRYSRAGTYSVTLSTGNAGGCATRLIFTGQTASCSGSPTAQITRPIIILAATPSAAITTPHGGETFVEGQKVPTRFACQESAGGPGLASCTDSNHAHAPTGHLNTAYTGAHTYTVTATSTDGQHATARSTYTVIAAARHPITIHTARATIRHRRIRIRLSCSARWPSSPCRGTLTIRVTATSARHPAQKRTVGTRTYAITRGTARTITITLNTATLALAKQRVAHGRISVLVNVTIRHGRTSTRTISLQERRRDILTR